MKRSQSLVLASLLPVALVSCGDKNSANSPATSSAEDSSVDPNTSTSSSTSEKELPAIVDYNEHVRPILSNTCFHCHGPDEGKRDADLALHSFNFATAELKNNKGKFGIVPGKPEQSEVIARVFAEKSEDIMPPADSIHKLSKRDKNMLKKWVEQGAQYKKHWAFIHPTKELPQSQKDNPWVTNEIDLFVAAKHQELGFKPSEEAAPQVWLRRVTHTLTGLPPTPQELSAFLAAPEKTRKQEAVDRLLASPSYGEHMAVAWMEAARYADTDGYQNDHERQNWPWRDYVIKSFNENKKFDQFTIEQMAGDMMKNPSHEQVIATAFNRNHRQNAEGGALPEEFLIENILDRVDTVGSIYFGLTMSCARCHDHKYDPLSQKEVFQFSAYFNNIKERPTARGIQAHPTRASLSLFANSEVQQLDSKRIQLEKQYKKAKEAAKKTLLASNPKLKGGPLNKAIAQQATVVEVKKSLDTTNAKLAKTGHHHRASVMVMHEAKGLTPAYILQRGQYDAPDTSTKLKRSVPAALLGDNPAPKDRLELAQWMMSEKNPITARVIVNRIWQHHFGTGLCKTSEDFGSQAAFPSHPKLLDYLAVEFRESGWDMKKMHKLIVLSSSYGQSSKVTPELLKSDVANKWLTRGARFRLSGFAIRDQALFSAGLLTNKLGGPSVKPYQPKGLWNSMSHSPNIFYLPSKGKDLYRRSLYTYWKRAVNPPRQLLFDGAGREICTVTQKRTNTPLQALVLLNDKTFLEAARVLAERVMQSDSKQPVEQIYQLATGYAINDANKQMLEQTYKEFLNYYTEHTAEAHAFISIGAKPLDKNLDQTTLAALTAVAHVVLNTDEVITIE